MLFCRKCGIDLLDDAKFCPECGTPIVKTSASQQEEKSSGDYSDKTQFRGKPQKYGVVSFENIPVGHIISERYEVKEKVGQGGFGAVYRCFDRNMNIDKALKVIPEAVSSDKEAMFDLQQEAQTMVTLNHPNIVRVYDFHRSGTIKFIDMEFLDGKNLNEIKLEFSDKKIPEARVKEYALKIAEGMLYAHESGDNVILHKDLKPHNIRLTSQGVIKIMDFGIAETVRTSMSRLEQGSSSGTLHYMSPEQLRGRDIGREADVYSYGALLYELLNGQPPFYKDSIEHQIINEQPKPIEHVSAEMNSFLLKCLEKDYKNRYRNFNEIIKALHGESSLVSEVGAISSPIQSRSITSEIKKLVEVSIETNPPVAVIDVDGSILKNTPFKQKLTVGKHHLTVRKSGYRQVKREIVITDSPENDYFIELESIMGSITVEADEPCDIVLNKKETGYKTPHTFTDIIPGEKYYVQVKKKGDHSLHTVLTIKEKESIRIKFLSVSIKTNPDAAVVDMLNTSIGQTPISLLLFPDKFQVKIRKEGYKSLETEITVSEDSSNEFHIDLESIMGSMHIELVKEECDIWINGRFTGKKTPATFDNLLPSTTYHIKLYGDTMCSDIIPVELKNKEIKNIIPVLKKYPEVNNMVFVRRRALNTSKYKDNIDEQVNLNSFYIGKYPVTQGEWIKVMNNNPSYFRVFRGGIIKKMFWAMKNSTMIRDRLNCPVESVSWYNTLVYCNRRSIQEGFTPVYSINGSTDPADWGSVPKIINSTWDKVICNWKANGYRLLTEAEWEYAVRGGINSPDYLYSGSDDIKKVAWYDGNNSPFGTKPVGSKAPNGLGIYEMTGNVWEWCWDWYDSSYNNNNLPSNSKDGPTRVHRGGGWNDIAEVCRVMFRSFSTPNYSFGNVGFRLCRTAEE